MADSTKTQQPTVEQMNQVSEGLPKPPSLEERMAAQGAEMTDQIKRESEPERLKQAFRESPETTRGALLEQARAAMSATVPTEKEKE